MKCLKCGAEWDGGASAGDVLICPACGTPQVRGAICDSLDGALLASLDYLGSRSRDGEALYACFIDFAPGMRREAKILRIFLACGGHTALLDARDADPADIRPAAERVVYRMKEELLGESLCRIMVAAFCRAIGYDLGAAFDGGVRTLRSSSGEDEALRPGTVLCGEYTVQSQLERSAEEADLYVCTRDGARFVARVGRNEASFRQEAVDALLKLEHPRVSRLCAAGSYDWRPVEIYPCFELGDLRGQTFREEDLVRWLIPDLNEGLHALHRAGVLHRGVKTSNAALSGDGEHACLMLSKRTVLEEGVGVNPYASPEESMGVCTEASDYYALGMVLFELYCGYAPGAGAGTAGSVAFPKEFPLRLRALITGLTWGAADERWGYEEIRRWLDGEMPPLPGGDFGDAVWIPEYRFMDTAYTDLSRLSAALSLHWNEGKEQLLHGLLTDYFRTWNLELSRKAQAAEEEAGRQGDDADLVFWRLLYQIDPAREDFCWLGRSYESLAAFGREALDRLWDGDAAALPYYTGVLDRKLLTKYAGLTAPGRARLQKTASEIEAYHEEKRRQDASPESALYLMGYLLSGQKFLLLDGNRIRTTGELAAYMRSLLADSFKKFEGLCHRLADVDGSLSPQLEAWLIAIGKREELGRWSDAMNA